MSKNAVNFVVTGRHFQYTATAIGSILDHYESSEPLMILVVCTDVRQKDIGTLIRMPKVYGKPMITIQCWAVPEEVKKISPDFTIGNGVPVPPMAIWRLFMPNYFHNYDKLLYLDNDVIVNTDVSKMFDLIRDEDMIAAVPDFLFSSLHRYDDSTYPAKELYGMQSMSHYFNNGVMLINVKNYLQLLPVDKLLEIINSTHYNLADQTIINIVAEGHVTLLPWQYNYQHPLSWFETNYDDWLPAKVQEIKNAYPSIQIRHFAGGGYRTNPYDHVGVDDEWEMIFWRTFYRMKILSQDANQNI